MDCQTANEYINAYADNMLNKKETGQLLSHISSCSKCKKDFDDCLAVKKALAGLEEVEPPAGLALSVIKKAGRRRIPVFVYASAGIAAVIALVTVFSSGMFNHNSYDTEMRNAAPAAYSQALAEDKGVQASYAPEAATMDSFALAPAATSAPSPEPSSMNDSEFSNETRKASVQYINVPADVSEDFRQSLETFLSKNDIDSTKSITGNIETISFKITEDKLSELKSLIDNLQYDEKLTAGQINFIFKNKE